ncbi:hypothetical protein PAPYR_12176 [Paratrimastix pyriformis]|uniref:Uncharacterized protein n=1 Tax=Paratrimastix pyriformis TaxID=342808 RepID=A0ABQ8U3Z4_9EUKA|nr:hypothetical protein PAPYR_12176 [Paratrimastix pyriformis]
MFAEHLLDALSRSACDPEIVQGIFSALAQKARQAVPGHQELAPQPSRELAPVPTTHLGQAAPVPTTHLGHATPQPTTHLGQAAPAPTTHLGQATPALGQPAFHPGPLPDIQMAVQPGVGQLFPDSTPVTPRPLRDPATRPLRDQVMDTQDVIPDSFPLPDDAKEWAKELANQAYLRFLKEQPAKALQLETAGTEPEEWFAKELRAKVSGMSPSAVRPMWRTELGRIRRNVSGLEAKRTRAEKAFEKACVDAKRAHKPAPARPPPISIIPTFRPRHFLFIYFFLFDLISSC